MRIFTHFTRVCSGDGVTGDGGYGNVTSDKIITGEVTGEGMVTGEAFLTGETYLDTLQMPPIQPYVHCQSTFKTITVIHEVSSFKRAPS